VCTAFSVSENHVTKDFRLYKEAFPKNIQYDERARAYRPAQRFRHRIGKGSPEEYLSLLRSQAEQHEGVLAAAAVTAVTTDAVPPPKGHLDAAVLNAVTRAIAGQTGLRINYQSRSKAEPGSRDVWPHALLFSGTRWHARAYDRNRNAFIDLVLQRILSTAPLDEKTASGSDQDAAWSNWVDIDVVPAKSLSSGQAQVVAREFGMAQEGRGWVWRARMRECLAGYFIYLHRLDLKNDPDRLIELKHSAVAERYLMPRDRGADKTSSGTG
jgi:predicted DNA-binding transcriptional regulator YafY